jgi:hypothetical protein
MGELAAMRVGVALGGFVVFARVSVFEIACGAVVFFFVMVNLRLDRAASY